MGMDSVFRVSLVLDLVDNMTDKVGQASGTIPGAVGKLNNAFGTMQKAGAAMTGIGTAITSACIGTVTATFDTQDALAEVASLGVEDLGTLERAAKDFSDTWAGTTKADFISASYDIKSGIASLTDEGVAQYTELAGLTAKATKATTADMTSLFATGYGIYKNYYSDLSDLEFGELFSAGISTAVKNYKTSGTEMAGAIKTLGASATNANVPMEEQLAILGQLQATMSGSEAGTKYKAFLNSAASAGKKLGLTFTDSNNQLLSMPDILEKLKGKYGDTIDAVEKKELKDAFGTDEAIALIDLLYNNTDQLKSGIEDLQTSMDGGIETTNKMAEAINDTPAQKFEVLKQQLHNATEELGQGLLPMVNNGLEAITGLVKKGSDWIANNQETVSTIMRIVAILGMFLIAAGAVTATVGTLGKALTSLKSVTKLAGAATGGFGSALLSSPIGWAIGMILALVAAFQLCGGDAGQLGEIFKGVFGKIGGFVGSAVTSVMQQLPQFLQFGLDLVMMIISGIASGLPSLITSGATAIEGLLNGAMQLLPTVLQTGLNLVMMLVQAIITGLPTVISAGATLIQSLVSGIANLLPTLLSAGVSMIQMLLSGIIQGLPAILTAGMTLIQSLVSGIANLLPTLLSAGVSMIQMLLSGIVQNLPAIITAGIQMIVTFLQGIVTVIPQLLNAGVQMIGTFLQGIATALPSLISGGIQMIAALLSGIVTAIPTLIGMIPELFSGVKDAVTSIDWLEVGSNLVNGIKDGFVEGFSSLVDTAKGLWDDFTGWLFGDDEVPDTTPVSTMASSIEGDVPKVETAVNNANQALSGLEFKSETMQQKGAESMQALADGITAGTPGAQAEAQTAGQDIMAAFDIDTSTAGTAGTDLMQNVMDSITSGTGSAEAAAQTAGQSIMGAFNIDTSTAGTAGTDLMQSVTDSITSGTGSAEAAAQMAGQNIMAAFQVDTSGAGTVGTDLMQDVTDGVTSGTGSAEVAAQTAGQDIMNAFKTTVSSASQVGSQMMQDVSSGISSAGSGAVSTAKGIASQIKSAFENMSITVPRPTLPHVSVSYSTVGDGKASASVPNFSVSYYAEGAIMKKPYMFGMNGNSPMVGGEAGEEAIVPLDSLWSRMQSVISTTLMNLLPKKKQEEGDGKREAKELRKETVSRYRFSSESDTDTGKKYISAKDRAKTVIIQKLEMNVDASTIDSVEKLRKILLQIEGDNDPVPIGGTA